MPAVSVREAQTPRDFDSVRQLCWEYRDFLCAFDESMRRIVDHFYPEADYRALMADLPEKHARPQGIVLLAEQSDSPIGCGMYHPFDANTCEIKRVFVAAENRSSGAGKKLSSALIEHARQDGYSRILLDTNAKFSAARRLYEGLGFRERGPYSDIADEVRQFLVFYELRL